VPRTCQMHLQNHGALANGLSCCPRIQLSPALITKASVEVIAFYSQYSSDLTVSSSIDEVEHPLRIIAWRHDAVLSAAHDEQVAQGVNSMFAPQPGRLRLGLR